MRIKFWFQDVTDELVEVYGMETAPNLEDMVYAVELIEGQNTYSDEIMTEIDSLVWTVHHRVWRKDEKGVYLQITMTGE